MSAQRVILITHGGPEIQAAVGLLTEWARHGLIHPFISYTDDQAAFYVGTRGVGEPTSVFAILGRQDLEVVRVAGLVGHDRKEAGELASRTRDLVDKIRGDLAPGGLRVVQVRIWAPYDPRPDGGWAVPAGAFSTAAEANLVLVPEDRQTGGRVGIPLARSDASAYGSHVATETATALGMWSSMSEAPVDALEGGVLGYGEPKVHLTRSFVRIAEIPAVSLAGAADHGGLLRVPPGCKEAPYPLESIAYAQDRIGSLLDRELIKTSPAQRSKHLGVIRLMREVGRGMVSSLRYMFSISGDVVDALRDMTGRVMQEAVGRDSVLRVIWRGMPSEGGEEERAIDAEKLIETIRRGRALEGGVRIDQKLWTDVGQAVFSMTDGGEMPEGVAPQKIDDRNVIVKEVGMIAPAHGPGLADDIRADSLDEAPATLLGRLGARLRRAEGQSRRRFEILVERSENLFEVEQPPALTTAGVVTSVSITLFAALLLLLTGLVELTGITGMGGTARAWIWVGVTAVYALGLVFLSQAVVARFRAESPAPPDGFPPPAAEVEEEEKEKAGDEPETEGAEDHPSPSAFRLWWSKATKWSDDLPNFNAVVLLAVLAGVIAAVVTAVVSRLGVGETATGTGVIDTVATAVARGLLAREDLAIGITVTLIFYAILLAFQLDREAHRSLESFRQVRLLFFFTAIYGAFGLVGLLGRDNGWYGEARSEGFGDLWIGMAVLLTSILLLLMAMAHDRYRKDNRARDKVSDLEREIAAAVDTQWVTEEALEQFIGSAAAWAAVMWKPFGEFDPGEGRTRDGFAFEVLKAETRAFSVTPLGAMAMRERMMKELAKPGWLSRRYQTAAEAYRRRRAVETGTEPDAILLPDQDPREVHTVPPKDRLKVSGRWRFVNDLTAGTYDRELSRALDALDHANAAEWVYKQEGTLEASETGGESLEQYLSAVVPQGAPEVSYVYFGEDARLDADRSYRPVLWWPSALLDQPDGRSLQCNIRSLVNGDLAIMSVRHDRAGPYPQSALFGPAAGEDEVEEDPDPGGGRSLRGPGLRRLRGDGRSPEL